LVLCYSVPAFIATSGDKYLKISIMQTGAAQRINE
jgi:hypothetical protein